MTDIPKREAVFVPSPWFSNRITSQCSECEFGESCFKDNHSESQAVYKSAKAHAADTGHSVAVQDIGLVVFAEVEEDEE